MGDEELNLLVWRDHSDPNLLKPFGETHDVRINVKEYEGTATRGTSTPSTTKTSQSPGCDCSDTASIV